MSRWLSLLVLVGASHLSAASLGAQTPAEPVVEAPPAAEQAARALVVETARRLHERYEVFALGAGSGLGLVPREEVSGVRLIEVSSRGVAVNGQLLDDEALEEQLGADAEMLRGIADLSAARRQALLEPPAPALPEGADLSDEDLDEAPVPPEETLPPEAPEPPQPRRPVSSEARVSVGSSLTIDDDEVAKEVLVVGGDLRIEGEVEGDATVLGGDADVFGTIGGNLTAVGGGIRLRDGSEVGGDVASVGDDIRRDDGAEVGGEVSEVAFGGNFLDWTQWLDGGDWRPYVHRPDWHHQLDETADVINGVLGMVFLALIAMLILLLGRAPVERISEAIRHEPWTAGLVGLLTTFLALILPLILTVVLVISVVGCVLLPLVPLLWLGFLIMALIGYTAAAYSLGRWVQRRFGSGTSSVYVVTLVGILLIQAWTLFGDVLDLGGWVLSVFALTFLFFGFVVKFCAWMVGIGGVVLVRFRQEPEVPAPPPALPPLPPLPEDQPTPPEPGSAAADLPSQAELEAEFERRLAEETPPPASPAEAPAPEAPAPESQEPGDKPRS